MPKFNENKTISFTNHMQSIIWKYLHEDIDIILNHDLDDKQNKLSYISSTEIEESLQQLLKYSATERYYMLSGLTGIGKTTFMRHVLFDDKAVSVPVIKGRSLLIPIDFDTIIEPANNYNYQIAFEEIFSDIFSQATILIREKYNIDIPSDKEFVEFFTNNHTGVVSYLDQGKKISNADIRKSKYNDRYNRIYAMIAELCLSLNHNKSRINNVVLIIDNIESLGVYNKQITVPLLIAHKALNFMCNKSIKNSKNLKKWTPSILICCRHYIYRMMHTRDFEDGSIAQIFESFAKPTYVHIDDAVGLLKLINKRFDAYMKTQKGKTEKWKESMQTAKKLISRIIKATNINENNIITDLNLSNIRSSLGTLKDVIYNKPWIQGDDYEDNGAFNITDLSELSPRITNILRAIGMQSGNTYHSINNLIPNLLENKPNNKVNIYTFVTLKYFFTYASSWNTPISIDDFYEIIDEIFNNTRDENKIKKQFEQAIWCLLNNRMLLRSADQEQQDIASITRNNFKEIKQVFVSTAAKDYWYILRENSVILEMLMDDIYLAQKNYNFKEPRKTNFRIFNKESFLIALDYLFEFFESERSFLQVIIDNTKESEYVSHFGSQLITEHLLDGLTKSFNNYFREDRRDEQEYKVKCIVKINSLREKIKNLSNTIN